ncbi:flippase-like domain-containing protein [candidate division WOR-3 bacterium]|nr:flippase-like domain-containing protein [candidate division WOR-3 bacterium]
MKKKLYFLIQLVLTLGLLTFLFAQVRFNLNKIVLALSQIPFLILLVCFALYLLTCVLRSIRFKIILNRKTELGNLFNIAALHNLFNNMLPARLGELSYVYLLGRKENIPAGTGTASLIVARIFDLISFEIFLILSILLTKDLLALSQPRINSVIFFLGLSLILSIFLLFWVGNIFRFVKSVVEKTNLKRFKLSNYIIRKLVELKEGLEDIKSFRKILSIFFTSILITFLLYYVNYILIGYMGIGLGFWKLVVAMSFTIVTVLLPIQSIGNLGTYEGAFLIGLVIFQVPKELAITVGFGIHLISYLFIIIIGGYGLIALKLK